MTVCQGIPTKRARRRGLQLCHDYTAFRSLSASRGCLEVAGLSLQSGHSFVPDMGHGGFAFHVHTPPLLGGDSAECTECVSHMLCLNDILRCLQIDLASMCRRKFATRGWCSSQKRSSTLMSDVEGLF